MDEENGQERDHGVKPNLAKTCSHKRRCCISISCSADGVWQPLWRVGETGTFTIPEQPVPCYAPLLGVSMVQTSPGKWSTLAVKAAPEHAMKTHRCRCRWATGSLVADVEEVTVLL